MKILLKLIYTFNTISFKISDDLFAATENLILKSLILYTNIKSNWIKNISIIAETTDP